MLVTKDFMVRNLWAPQTTNIAWLAQLVGCQSAVQEIEGPSPRPDHYYYHYYHYFTKSQI